MDNAVQTSYREIQRFRQPWIWLIACVVIAMMWYAAIVQLVFGRPFGTRPAPDGVLLGFWIVFGIGLPLLLYSTRLLTEVRDDGIYVKFFPFHRSPRRIPFGDVTQSTALTFHPIRDYGGWGVRCGPEGRAYIVSGDRGVQLKLSNGEILLVGSQRPDELVRAIQAKS
jgi:Family of unknown function (DUF6141)